MPCLGDLDDDTIIQCVRYLATGHELSVLQCCSRRWRELAAHDLLWRVACTADFGLRDADEAGAESGAAPCSYKKAWLSWRGLSKSLGYTVADAPLFMRAERSWTRISAWLRANELSPIAETFQGPVVASEWDAMVTSLGLEEYQEGLQSLRAILSVHNGQDILFDRGMEERKPRRPEDQNGIFQGVFGGYNAYDHLVCTRLLPLARMVSWSKKVREAVDHAGDHCVVFAASFNMKKILLLDAQDGTVHILMSDGLHLASPAFKEAPAAAAAAAAPPPSRVASMDGLSRWFETWAERLTSGVYERSALLPEHAEMSMGVSILPVRGPAVSRTVTRGIEVIGRSIYAVEQGGTPLYVYSLRVRLLSPDEEGGLTAAQRGFETAQLNSRHLILSNADGSQEHVRGSGVVGNYPLLREGGWRNDRQDQRCHMHEGVPPEAVQEGGEEEGTFVYQSQAQPANLCAFAAELEFVPGTLHAPAGPPFNALVSPFPLTAADDFTY